MTWCVLALLSAGVAGSRRPRRWEIWAGQYLGFAVPRSGLSLAAGPRACPLVPARWLWLLGPDPAHPWASSRSAAAIRAARGGEPPTAGQPSGRPVRDAGACWCGRPAGGAGPVQRALAVVDGRGRRRGHAHRGRTAPTTWPPTRRSSPPPTPAGSWSRSSSSRCGVAVWCAAGALLIRHHRITDALARYGHWILPVAFILIGLYTLARHRGRPVRLRLGELVAAGLVERRADLGVGQRAALVTVTVETPFGTSWTCTAETPSSALTSVVTAFAQCSQVMPVTL